MHHSNEAKVASSLVILDLPFVSSSDLCTWSKLKWVKVGQSGSKWVKVGKAKKWVGRKSNFCMQNDARLQVGFS